MLSHNCLLRGWLSLPWIPLLEAAVSQDTNLVESIGLVRSGNSHVSVVRKYPSFPHSKVTYIQAHYMDPSGTTHAQTQWELSILLYFQQATRMCFPDGSLILVPQQGH